MLAERVTEWTRQWKQEGFEEGKEEGKEEGRQEGQEETLKRLRGALLREMENRFGPIPESVRGKVAAVDSVEEIVQLIARTATASSLATLGL